MVAMTMRKPAEFNFLAGQFVQFSILERDKPALRSYSIASDPSAPELTFCVKMLPGGLASTYFGNLKPDEMLSFTGPQGRFVCAVEGSPLLFVATGAGLAPILAMITDELQNKKNTMPITLLFGLRSEADIFWIEELDHLKNAYGNFSYTLTLSQPTEAWAGKNGRVTAYASSEVSGMHCFLCGSGDMVKEMREILLSRGVPSNAIHFEIF